MKYLKVLTDFAKTIEKLSDAEKGRLFDAMLRYAETGEEPTINGNERFVWPIAKMNIDQQANKYNARCEINKKNAAMRWDANGCESHQVASNRSESQRKEKGEEKESTKEKEYPKRNTNIYTRFIPPSIEDVKEYCIQKGYKIDTERFVDYYTSNGWMVGKNKMKDWKAAVRTWVKNSTQKEDKKTNNIFLQILEDEYGQVPNNVSSFGS